MPAAAQASSNKSGRSCVWRNGSALALVDQQVGKPRPIFDQRDGIMLAPDYPIRTQISR